MPRWFPTFVNEASDENRINEFVEQEVIQNFLFIRQSTITSFFSLNMIDMPLCFKKSKSLYSKTFELPALKLSNMLMRDGLRAKIFKSLTLSLNKCALNLLKPNHPDYTKWASMYVHFLALRTDSNQIVSTHVSTDESRFLGSHTLVDMLLNVKSRTGALDLLLDKIKDFLPLFSFFIRKVDKSIRKHSRGKSGKYTIIWKYIPTYKRLYVTMRWFLKDLKFQKARKLDSRLYKTIETFFLSPELSFVAKLRRFSHFFVFHNYKKTLMRSLKSAS